ncbi:hypothetical protein TCON_2747 [Astathelohania contejeani]|uniref:Uncharacterized protein n=1 Tax=Astathelohania contejeani TaxID=164912 RepID=A0ABQ7HV47_9MICR|nr:hypothetical protein TCON_2747 [Thelohania contejeani]
MRGAWNCCLLGTNHRKIFVGEEKRAKQKRLDKKQRRLAIKAEMQCVAFKVKQKRQQQIYRESKKERESRQRERERERERESRSEESGSEFYRLFQILKTQMGRGFTLRVIENNENSVI